MPGETAAPGSVTGKTGTPSTQVVDAGFRVTVNAVDDYWNLVNTAIYTVGLSSSDATANLPPDAAQVAGTGSFEVTLNTAGTATLTASDLSDGSKSPSTSPAINVNAAQHTPATVRRGHCSRWRHRHVHEPDRAQLRREG